ncbi:hypothetical protein ACFOPN_08390 [Xanthomonas hyacinthi]|uniref:hypothetical protein n=1 Tax=Xanthomonas hyacinthi TaxID=56455 RepID=UPI0036197264
MNNGSVLQNQQQSVASDAASCHLPRPCMHRMQTRRHALLARVFPMATMAQQRTILAISQRLT